MRPVFVACAAALAVVTAPVPASAAVLDRCYPLVGHVSDPAGRAVPAARVSTPVTCSGPAAVDTDARGRYVLHVPGGSLGTTADVTVTRLGYDTVTQRASVSPDVAGGLTTYTYEGTDVTLLLQVVLTLAPKAVRPGGTVEVSVRTVAPPLGPGLPAKVLATLAEAGSGVALTPVTGADGWTTWQGTVAVPADARDGDRSVRVCAVLPEEPGTCDTGTRLSLTRWGHYVVDGTPPVLVRTGPAHLGTVTRVTDLWAHWLDYGSGVTTATAELRVWVDGVERPTWLSGGYVYASLAGLAPGPHGVRLEAADKAGNTTVRRQVFLLTTLAATPGSATLAETTVPVNPGATLPPPATVTFRAPRVAVDEYTATAGGNSWVGRGTLRRPFSFGSYQVEFVNETGVPKTVTVAAPTAYAQHTAGLLSVTTSPLRGFVPAASLTVADVTVAVPTGYGTPGSTATLKQAVATLGRLDTLGTDLAAGGYSGSVTVQGLLAACDADGAVTCAADQAPRVTVSGYGVNQDVVYTPAGPRDDDTPDAVEFPLCETVAAAPAGQGCALPYKDAVRARALFGCASQYVYVTQDPGRPTWVDLCDGSAHLAETPEEDAPRPFFTAYLNGWTHEVTEADGVHHPTWQQSRVELSAAGGSCPNGRTGVVTAGLRRVAANTGATGGGGAEVAGTWREHIAERTYEDPQTVELGRRRAPTGNGQAVTRQPVVDPARPYQLTDVRRHTPLPSDQGWYELRRDGWVDGEGTRRSDSPYGSAFTTWTSTGWRYDDPADGTLAAPQAQPVRLVTGSDFTAPDPLGYGRLYLLAFQFAADFSGCRAG